MKLNKVDFVASYVKVADCPDSLHPEFAFIGRSNVGKSSLINMLTGRKALAKVSGMPGKTQLINFFEVNESWHLVDLPGYGYAKASKSARKAFDLMIRNYLKLRSQLQCAFLLIDSNIPPQELDLKMMDFCGENGIPLVLILTKTDKLRPSKKSGQIEVHLKAWREIWEKLPTYFLSSASNNEGREEILNFIESVIELYKANSED